MTDYNYTAADADRAIHLGLQFSAANHDHSLEIAENAVLAAGIREDIHRKSKALFAEMRNAVPDPRGPAHKMAAPQMRPS